MSKTGFRTAIIPIVNEPSRNSVLDFGDFHLSYNPYSGDYGSDTTAIVLNNTVFLVLNGDHKKELEEASKEGGLQACFDYFLGNLVKANHISEHHTILKGLDTFSIKTNAEKALGHDNIARLLAAGEALKSQPAPADDDTSSPSL